ncbi:biotin--[acetyl-CoA-carboxylase] ligase [Winogradskyella sp. PE311]|uniref:biotin--[acetyl-CoA-carboxylase] ligase n=1 Tax=Winogradskyella sp. PE311 TaxID=3366943 RepID=UPI00397F84E4
MMYIIKLDAIDSTNTYLKDMASMKLPKDYTVIVAEHQRKGRGQMGTHWQTEQGKGLTASVFKTFNHFKIEQQFYISMVVSLAIYSTLKSYHISKLHIKWPNDILSANKKVCGILIENIIKHNQFTGSVIGFGLNVNQKYFNNLPSASSMNIITGVVYDKDEVLSKILEQLQFYFGLLEAENYKELKVEYEKSLFRYNKPSTFVTPENEAFVGIIKGVNESGKLKVWTENEVIKTFDLKEVKLLF